MRLFLLALVACNSNPLDLPEVTAPPLMKRSPEAIVQCGEDTCDRGQYCCTHDDGVHGTCLGADAINSCYTFYGCDGPEDCINGAICCESYAFYNGSACVDPSGCVDVAAWLMCHHDADCPAVVPHCCPQLGSSLARCSSGCAD